MIDKIPDGMILYIASDGEAWLTGEDPEFYVKIIQLGKLQALKIGDGGDPEVFVTKDAWQEEE